MSLIKPIAADRDGAGAPRDEFEFNVVDEITRAPAPPAEADNPRFFDRLVDESTEYQYYQPIYAEASSCVVCHNAMLAGAPSAGGLGSTPLAEGDLAVIVGFNPKQNTYFVEKANQEV